MAGENRREPRYRIAVDANFAQGSVDERSVKVINLSSTGCRFASPGLLLRRGTLVNLTFGRAGTVGARVRWRVGEIHGVRFDIPLQPAVFDHIRLFLSEEPAVVAERDALSA